MLWYPGAHLTGGTHEDVRGFVTAALRQDLLPAADQGD